jgi:hypothetical protein
MTAFAVGDIGEPEVQAVSGAGEGDVKFAVLFLAFLEDCFVSMGFWVIFSSVEQPAIGLAERCDFHVLLGTSRAADVPKKRAKHHGILETLGGVNGEELDGGFVGL